MLSLSAAVEFVATVTGSEVFLMHGVLKWW